MTEYPTVYWGGAPYIPGTVVPANVVGECGHLHRTPEAAEKCIERFNNAVKRGHGSQFYADMQVMEGVRWRENGTVMRLSGTTQPYNQ